MGVILDGSILSVGCHYDGSAAFGLRIFSAENFAEQASTKAVPNNLIQLTENANAIVDTGYSSSNLIFIHSYTP